MRWQELAEASTGLFALTGDEEGPVSRAWRSAGAEGAEAALRRLLAIFGRDRLGVEIQRHFVRGEERENRMRVELAAAHHLPLIATNGVLHANPAGREVLDIFTCIRHHTHLDAAGALLSPNAERHLKPAAAMAALFADLPEAVANTARFAERLEFGLENLGYEFPSFPVPPGETMDTFLRKLTWFGAQQRYGSISPAVRAQLDRELALIAKLGFAGYFLVVWEICNFCREQNILVQGRGSAANSAVCYSLGITAVDPVGGRLLFERFLSEGRSSWPDIDLDLPSGDRRERVIQEVYRRYAPRGAAMTANVITYRGRSTMRELGKALNLPENVMDRFSSLYAHGDFPHTIELAGAAETGRIAGVASARCPRSSLLAQRLRGLPRHLGQHSGGMIICQGQLDSVVPLENASMPGRVVAQWDKDDCEDLGIIKVDLLGLGMMAALQDSLEICQARGRPVDLARIPKDDPATFALLQKADTIGVFQVESRAQMATLPRMKPGTFYDLAVEVAIIRPGPIHGDAVHPYLERRAGRQAVTYPDERLRPILERTLGVTLFQEQILKIAMVLGGLHRRRGRRVAAGHRLQALDRAHGTHAGEAARSHGAQRRVAGRDRRGHQRAGDVRALRLSGKPRAQLRPDRVCELLPEGPSAGGILCRAHQQPADGILQRRHAHPGRPAARRPRAAGLRRRFAMADHGRGGRRHPDRPAPRARAARGDGPGDARRARRAALRVDGGFPAAHRIQSGGAPGAGHRRSAQRPRRTPARGALAGRRRARPR